MSDTIGGNEIAGNFGDAFCAVNPHCLESIVRLADVMDVTASCDIVDETGKTLWTKGVPVSSGLQQKLQGRRLQKPLEASLDVEGGTTLQNIVSHCFELMETHPALRALGGASRAGEGLRALCNIPLHGPLKLMLTSARVLQKRTFDSHLAAMIVSAGLAASTGLDDQDTDLLILSALMCDLGELYVGVRDPGQPLRPSEWKQIAMHPVIGRAFLKAFTHFPAALADSVLHHHERLDGSGYPSGLSGADVSPLGQLTAVADVVSAIVMRGEYTHGAALCERLVLALTLVPGEFPPAAVSFIAEALAISGYNGGVTATGSFEQRVLPTLKQLRSARLLAEALVDSAPARRLFSIGVFAFTVLRSLDKSLRATGVYDFAQLGVLESDPDRMGKTCLMLDEVTWRLHDLARIVYLRTAQSGDPDELAQVSELLAALNALR